MDFLCGANILVLVQALQSAHAQRTLDGMKGLQNRLLGFG
jgi:hypothetical protein